MKRSNLMVANAVGTTLESHDVFVFGACAVLAFDIKTPCHQDPFGAILLSLGTFSVDFLARPLYGILFGVAGDGFGRKKKLMRGFLYDQKNENWADEELVHSANPGIRASRRSAARHLCLLESMSSALSSGGQFRNFPSCADPEAGAS